MDGEGRYGCVEDGVELDGGEVRSCLDVCLGEGEAEGATEIELALAKLVVLDCGSVSSTSVPVLGVEMAASSSGWAIAYAASTVSIHFPS